MLNLKDISKDYYIDKELSVHALKDLNLQFPDKGFVSILGPSGCGKTTLLNILGGLDRYTSGDLIVDGKSTSGFNDHDWDNYRNKKIGMVFQSYNLIGHMSVLSNAEIALTLSGVDRATRKALSIEALRSVGLENEIKKRPNQLSGGQMQRVALARAIVNNPSVVLADEPTGALDSVTSIQIMDILSKIASSRLVIMVTHNRKLADSYSSRIIEISDGEVIKDYENTPTKGELAAKPLSSVVEEKKEEDQNKKVASDYTLIDKDFSKEVKSELKKGKVKKKQSAMSFLTALSLSFTNLKTKKGRTILTSVAGSFGIIGVALVLSLSNGFTNYIDGMQSESLAQFPISVEEYSADYTSDNTNANVEYPDDHDVIVKQAATTSYHVNNITDDYITYLNDIDSSIVSSVNYNYALRTNVLSKNTSGTVSVLSTDASSYLESLTSSVTSSSYWYQLPSNDTFVQSKYDLIEGKYPTSSNEAVLVVDKYNSLSTTILKALGYDTSKDSISVSSILSKEFKMVDNDNYYTDTGTTTAVTGKFLKDDNSTSLTKMLEYISQMIKAYSNNDLIAVNSYQKLVYSFFNDTEETRNLKSYTTPTSDELTSLYDDSSKSSSIKIVGILRPNKSSVASMLSPGVYCKTDLVTDAIDVNKTSSISTSYKNNMVLQYSSLLGDYYPTTFKVIDNNNAISYSNLSDLVTNISNYISQRKILGTDISVSSITIYPKDFSLKKKVLSYLDAYNTDKADTDQIKYTDLAGTVFSSFEAIVNIISTVLIAFASISLVVSSVMTGIIIYNSVIERTKEIGILRAIGARKKDISRLFKAEAVIIGLFSGVVGIGVTYLLCIPLNMIFNNLNLGLDLSHLAQLNPWHALILLAISIVLNFIASLIPSRFAAKKDPVVALRSE